MTYDPNNPYQQQQYQQPQAIPQQQQQAAPQQYQQQQQVAPQQPMLTEMPQYHMPDESVVRDAFEQAKQSAMGGGGDGPKFYKFSGPNGDTQLPVGYKAKEIVRLLPSWAPGKNFFLQSKSHFYRSQESPRGTSIQCPGSDTCLVCQARKAAFANPAFAEQMKSRDGKLRTQYIYQIAILVSPEVHMMQAGGAMKPILLAAPLTLHNAIGNLVEARGGVSALIEPNLGRPIKIMKEKSGPRTMDVDYSAIDENPMPLPQAYWPLLQNLWDLESVDTMPSQEQMVAAVQALGLPVPGSASNSNVILNPGPMSPHGQQAQVLPNPTMYQQNAPTYNQQVGTVPQPPQPQSQVPQQVTPQQVTPQQVAPAPLPITTPEQQQAAAPYVMQNGPAPAPMPEQQQQQQQQAPIAVAAGLPPQQQAPAEDQELAALKAKIMGS